jgi:hypothetical protein
MGELVLEVYLKDLLSLCLAFYFLFDLIKEDRWVYIALNLVVKLFVEGVGFYE